MECTIFLKNNFALHFVSPVSRPPLDSHLSFSRELKIESISKITGTDRQKIHCHENAPCKQRSSIQESLHLRWQGRALCRTSTAGNQQAVAGRLPDPAQVKCIDRKFSRVVLHVD